MRPVSIVGVLNVTPDSYFDGGKYNQLNDAVRRAGELLQEGADVIDIGGESTGPGSKDVSVDAELERTIPVITAIKSEYPEAKLSVDTYKSAVAAEAIKAGACMINDVTAGRGDPEMFSVVAATNAQVVLMYAKDNTPRTTIQEAEYDDVVATISQFLTERIAAAKSAQVNQSNIIIDPGMGHFISAKPAYSFEVIKRLSELASIAPVYVSPSRKSFLAGSENLPPAERLPGTIAASVIAYQNGASYLRTHDVLAMRRAIEIVQAL